MSDITENVSNNEIINEEITDAAADTEVYDSTGITTEESEVETANVTDNTGDREEGGGNGSGERAEDAESIIAESGGDYEHTEENIGETTAEGGEPDAAEGDDSEGSDETGVVESEPKKNRWTWVTTIVVAISLLIILGLAALLLYKDGTLKKWWDDIRPKTKSVCVMEDYSEIQVLKSAVELSEDTVASYVYSIIGDEVTDEAVQAYAASHSDCDASTVEELSDYARDYIYRYYLHNEIMNYLKSITTVSSYDEEMEQALIDYSADELDYYASSSGMDADSIAAYYGFEDALTYETETAHDYQTIAMILDQVMKDKGLSYTDEELRADLEIYLEDRGYTPYYTVDSFLEETGDIWLYLYENLTYKFNIAMEALEPNVVFIDEPAE